MSSEILAMLELEDRVRPLEQDIDMERIQAETIEAYSKIIDEISGGLTKSCKRSIIATKGIIATIGITGIILYGGHLSLP